MIEKKPSIWRWIGAAAALLLAIIYYVTFGPSSEILVSRETTYLIEPLRADGTPDYARWLDRRQHEGLTDENNAAPLFWQAMWPGELTPEQQALLAAELHFTTRPGPGMEGVTGKSQQALTVQWLAEQSAADPTGSVKFDSNNREQSADDFVYAAMARPWTSAEIPLLAEWISANELPLDLLVEASRRPRYYSPSPSLLDSADHSLFWILLPDLHLFRDAANGLAVRAMCHLGEGRTNDAWGDLLAVHRLAHLAAQSDFLVYHTTAIAVSNVAIDGTIALLDKGNLSRKQTAAILRDLHDIGALKLFVQSVQDCERFFGLDTAIRVAHGKPMADLRDLAELDMPDYQLLIYKDPTGRFLLHTSIDWNFVLRRMNGWFDAVGDIYQQTDRPLREELKAKFGAEMDQIEERLWQPFRWNALDRGERSNRAAELLGYEFVRALGVTEVYDRSHVQFDLLLVAVALTNYKAIHGRYPDALDELIPEIVSELPKDFYTDKPFIYKLADDGAGYLLYSVFENGVDDDGTNLFGGIVKGEWVDTGYNPFDYGEKVTDLVIRLPIPPLKLPMPPVSK